jgi:protein-S-isoprenylcysteine O-methyltransferase Ste14
MIPGFIIMGVSMLSYYRFFGGIKSIYIVSKPVSLDLKGIHKYVRHPLYSGTLLFIWGLFFIFPFLNNLIAVVIITAYVVIGIKFEEKKLIKTFANGYISYMKEVPSLFPRFR